MVSVFLILLISNENISAKHRYQSVLHGLEVSLVFIKKLLIDSKRTAFQLKSDNCLLIHNSTISENKLQLFKTFNIGVTSRSTELRYQL